MLLLAERCLARVGMRPDIDESIPVRRSADENAAVDGGLRAATGSEQDTGRSDRTAGTEAGVLICHPQNAVLNLSGKRHSGLFAIAPSH